MSVLPDRLQPGDHAADPGRRSSRTAARRTAGRSPTWPTSTSARPSARSYDVSTILILWFAGASAMAGHAQPDPALPPPLRHGPGVGGRRAAAGHRPHRRRVPHHLDLRRRRRRPGRRLRHRRAGADDLRGRRGHPRRAPGRPAQADGRVRADRAGLRLHDGRQRARAPGRRQDRRLLHRRDHRSSPCCRGWRGRSSCGRRRSPTTREPSLFLRDCCAPDDPAGRQRARTPATWRSTATRSRRSSTTTTCPTPATSSSSR